MAVCKYCYTFAAMIETIKKYRIVIGLMVLSLLLWQCARRGSPTGGPKDTTAPVLLHATPKSGQLNFKAKKIRLQFDEFVVTKDVRKQLIISPPMETFPIITPTSASKWLEITIVDTLKPNTTYVMNFGNSIQDYNEGNPYNDFMYVFSTGSYLDSLWVEGDVEDAIAPEADHFVTVMLYDYNEQYNDSLVYKQKPKYVTNTLDSLYEFDFDFLKEGKYKLIALKDKNGNYLFNPKEDKIAFLKEPITVAHLKDSMSPVYRLRLFKEVPPYKAHRPTQVADNRIEFGFEGKADSVVIKPISKVSADFKYTLSKDPKKDTLNLWYSPKQKDSVLFTVAHQQKIDTFKVRLKELKKLDSLQVSAAYSGDLPMERDFAFKSNIPIVATDASKIKIFKGKDSIPIPFKASLEKEGLELRLAFEKQHGESYRVEALPKALTDFFGNTNDTLKVSASTKKEEDLAIFKLKLTAEKVRFPVIVQLTNEKGTEVARELYAEKPEVLYLFKDVLPAKYRLRLIEDRNANKQWDTGDFLKQQQPERVWYFKDLVELRANWEVEETWQVSYTEGS